MVRRPAGLHAASVNFSSKPTARGNGVTARRRDTPSIQPSFDHQFIGIAKERTAVEAAGDVDRGEAGLLEQVHQVRRIHVGELQTMRRRTRQHTVGPEVLVAMQ